MRSLTERGRRKSTKPSWGRNEANYDGEHQNTGLENLNTFLLHKALHCSPTQLYNESWGKKTSRSKAEEEVEV